MTACLHAWGFRASWCGRICLYGSHAHVTNAHTAGHSIPHSRTTRRRHHSRTTPPGSRTFTNVRAGALFPQGAAAGANEKESRPPHRLAACPSRADTTCSWRCVRARACPGLDPPPRRSIGAVGVGG
jgi:hypothetical protein